MMVNNSTNINRQQCVLQVCREPFVFGYNVVCCRPNLHGKTFTASLQDICHKHAVTSSSYLETAATTMK